MKINLTYVKRDQKTSKAGKTYTSLSIKTVQHGDRFINGFGNKENENWAVGSEVEANIVEKEYQGKMYLNFEMPKIADKVIEVTHEIVGLSLKLGVINSKIDLIMKALKIETRENPRANLSPALQEQIAKDEINAEEIPF